MRFLYKLQLLIKKKIKSFEMANHFSEPRGVEIGVATPFPKCNGLRQGRTGGGVPPQFPKKKKIY